MSRSALYSIIEGSLLNLLNFENSKMIHFCQVKLNQMYECRCILISWRNLAFALADSAAVAAVAVAAVAAAVAAKPNQVSAGVSQEQSVCVHRNFRIVSSPR